MNDDILFRETTQAVALWKFSFALLVVGAANYMT